MRAFYRWAIEDLRVGKVGAYKLIRLYRPPFTFGSLMDGAIGGACGCKRGLVYVFLGFIEFITLLGGLLYMGV